MTNKEKTKESKSRWQMILNKGLLLLKAIKYKWVLQILILLAAFAIGFMAKYITHKNDSVIEQVAERVIKQITDREIDLSP